MNNKVKISALVGGILYALATFFALCLLAVLFDYAGDNPAKGLFLYRIGKMFTGVYGFCSILIPAFLLVAAFQCFTAKWHVRNGVMLLGSIIPFFTLDAVEHVCHMMASSNEGDALVMKIGAALLTGAVIIAVEYLVLSMIGDAVEGKETKNEFEKSESPAKAEVKVASKEEIEYENAVAKDAEEIRQHKNDLKELKERLAAHRSRLQDIKESEEKAKLVAAMSQEVAAEIKAKEEAEAADEAAVPASETIVTEDNPFAHVFDDAENDIVLEDETTETAVETEAAVEETPAAAVAENDEDPFADLSAEIPEENAIRFDDSVYDAEEVSETESNYVEEEYEVPSEQPASPEETSPFDDFDFPSEMGEEAEESPAEVEEEVPAEKTEEPMFEPVEEPVFEVSEEPGFEPAEEPVFEASEEPVFESENLDDSDFELPDFDETEENNSAEEEVVIAEDSHMRDISFSTEFDDSDSDENDLSDFVEERNSSFESIFAQMDSDAAANPVESKTSSFDDDFDSMFDDNAAEKGVPQELDTDYSVHDDEYEFDPMAHPVVDSNGMPFGEAVPFDIGDTSFEEVTTAKKTSKPLSFAEKAVFLQDSGEEQVSSKSTKVAVDSEGKPVVDVEKIAKKKPKLKLSNYKIPVDGILQEYDNGEYWVIDEDTKQKAADLKQTLSEFNIDVEITGIRKGPVVTMFEVLPAPGVNVNKIRSLQDNIALRLAATSVRIVSPIPGKSAVGIEIPNKGRAIVSFREIMEQKNPNFEKMNIPVILGKDISGEPQIIDLAKTPHLLIAGSTGAGKSVCVNSLILSILYKRNPQQVKLILVDPKVVELKLYNDIPHLLTPVITEPKKALQSLQYCLCEMERRYALLDNMGVRDINSYNRRIEERKLMQEKLPYIVVIIDEFADLMATTGKELESNVARLAAMSRAVGIHLVLATQRPSVNVITGLIKANIPSRIAFMVASRTDSNIIIDQIGAEKLLGKGDMLYASATDPFPVRIQGTLVSDDEVEKVVEYVKQYGEPDYIDDEIFVEDDEEGDGNPGLFSDGEDALYDEALQIVVQSGKASASYLQRRLKIGYNRAARLVEEMEERGIVGPANGSKPREVIYVP